MDTISVRVYKEEDEIYDYNELTDEPYDPIQVMTFGHDQISYYTEYDTTHAECLGYVPLCIYWGDDNEYVGDIVGKLYRENISKTGFEFKYFVLSDFADHVTVNEPYWNSQCTADRNCTYLYKDKATWIKVEDHRREVDMYDTTLHTVHTTTNTWSEQYWLPLQGDTDTSPGRYMDVLGPYPEDAVYRPLPSLQELKDIAYKVNAEKYHTAILQLVKDTLCLPDNAPYTENPNVHLTNHKSYSVSLSARPKYLDDAYWMFFMILHDYVHHYSESNPVIPVAVETYAHLCSLPIEEAVLKLQSAKKNYDMLMQQYATMKVTIEKCAVYVDCYKLVKTDQIQYTTAV